MHVIRVVLLHAWHPKHRKTCDRTTYVILNSISNTNRQQLKWRKNRFSNHSNRNNFFFSFCRRRRRRQQQFSTCIVPFLVLQLKSVSFRIHYKHHTFDAEIKFIWIFFSSHKNQNKNKKTQFKRIFAKIEKIVHYTIRSNWITREVQENFEFFVFFR